MTRKSIKVNDLIGALVQLVQFVNNHRPAIANKGMPVDTLLASIQFMLAALQALEQAQEDAKSALRNSTLAVDAGVDQHYPGFSSMIDLLRGVVGNTTPEGKQLTRIRKLVTGGTAGTGGTSSSTSGGGSSSSSGGGGSSSSSSSSAGSSSSSSSMLPL